MIAIVSIIAIACVLATLVAVALVRSGDDRSDHAPLLGKSRQPWLEASLFIALLLTVACLRGCP